MNNFSTDITYLKTLELFPEQNHIDDFLKFPRPHHILSFLIDGEAIFKSNESVIKLCGGDVLFIPYGTVYSSLWSGSHSHCISLFFNTILGCTKFRNKKFILQKIENSEQLFEDFIFIHENREKLPFLSIGRFYELLETISNRITYTDAPQLDERIQLAVDYIDANYMLPFGIEELAHTAHMSTPNFYKCFKKNMGVSPLKYKNDALITAAIKLLTDNCNMSIEEISVALGFKSTVYFRRLFKQALCQ